MRFYGRAGIRRSGQRPEVPLNRSVFVAIANHVNGVMCIGGDPAIGSLAPLVLNVAAFVQGMIASINFSQTNGRITLAGKSAQSAAVLPTCANLQTYQNLLANGYSCYGAFASRNAGFTFFSNGNMPGSFPWADQYIDQIWLSAQLQLALLNLYTTINDIPYDPTGYGLIRAALVGQATANGGVTYVAGLSSRCCPAGGKRRWYKWRCY